MGLPLKTGHGGRSLERLRHHYDVERELADRLRAASTRADRSRLLATMYAELFARVPDHPRLTIQQNPESEQRQVKRLLDLMRQYLNPSCEYVEFGGGAGTLAFAVCPFVHRVRLVEIADQIPATAIRPANFELVLYDGYELDMATGSVDVVFSEQFVEHLHPADALDHFKLVHRLLRPGGRYILRTPERWTGPHDISRWFSDTPRGFHLREWSYRDLADLGRDLGFRHRTALWNAGGLCYKLPLRAALTMEAMVAAMPRSLRQWLGHRFIPGVTMILEK
jgi:SAM-dependent methyltransferase